MRRAKLTGVVVGAATGEPIPGAAVSLWDVIGDSVKGLTGPDGSFELGEVRSLRGELLLIVEGPEHATRTVVLSELPDSLVVKVRRAPVLKGIVRDSAGKPVPRVAIATSRFEATTEADGTFEICLGRPEGEREGAESHKFVFRREEFRPLTLRVPEGERGPVEVVLERLPLVRGRVLDPHGRPVTSFTVFVGIGFPRPLDLNTTHAGVKNADGRFQLYPPFECSDLLFESELYLGQPEDPYGTWWVGVYADGLAPWEAVLTRDAVRDEFAVRMERGVEVIGSLRIPASAKQVRVHIIPAIRRLRMMRREVPALVHAARTATPDAGGAFRFGNIRPGDHVLYVDGQGLTPLEMDLAVGERGADVGAVVVKGTGIVCGQIIDSDGEPLPLARAELQVRECGIPPEAGGRGKLTIPFMTDTEGRFRVEGVPARVLWVVGPVNWMRWAEVDVEPEEGKETRVLLDLAKDRVQLRL